MVAAPASMRTPSQVVSAVWQVTEHVPARHSMFRHRPGPIALQANEQLPEVAHRVWLQAPSWVQVIWQSSPPPQTTSLTQLVSAQFTMHWFFVPLHCALPPVGPLQ
jgi:hypothetical protein